MRLFRTISVCLIWSLLLVNCLSPVEIATLPGGGQLVVDGQISTLPDQNIIHLGITSGPGQLPVPLSGAKITLFDGADETEMYFEDPLQPGAYGLPDVAGIPDHVYHIVITTPDETTYTSTPEKIPMTAGTITCRYELIRESFSDQEGVVSNDQFMKIYGDASVPQLSDYYKWSIEEAFLLSPTDTPDIIGNDIPPPCFIVQQADPQRIVLFDRHELNTTTINDLLMGSRIIDWTFLEKHYFTIYQTSLTKEAYAFWQQVRILSNNVGSIFDTPPAAIIGNIRRTEEDDEDVYGYFQGVNQTYDRIVVYPTELPFPLLMRNCTYEPLRSKSDYPNRCWDCIGERNSSYRRPAYF